MMTLAMIGWQELLVIGVVAVLIFGRRLPEVGRSLGQGLLEFKKSLKGVKGEVKEVTDEAKKIAADTEAAAGSDDQKG